MILDLSNELYIGPFNNGVKLFTAESLKKINDEIYATNHNRIADLLKLPVNVYFLNPESELQLCNEQNVDTCGYNSFKDAIGTNIRVVAKNDTGENLIHNDRAILKEQKLKIIEESHTKTVDELVASGISFKVPHYGSDNEIVGIFGMTARLEANAPVRLDHAISCIVNTGLFSLTSNMKPNFSTISSAHFPGNQLNDMHFSLQEQRCLHYLVRGKSVKAIAQKLALSPKTVENYLVNMKFKAKVNTTSDLIEMAIDAIVFQTL